MSLISKHNLSKQTIKIYQLLFSKKPLTSKAIAASLKILPNAVYRVVNKLINLGLIEQKTTYPRSYMAKPIEKAWNNYVSYHKNLFSNLMPKTESKIKNNLIDFDFIFIQGRKAVFERCIKDLGNTKRMAKFIVLGLSEGISPELMLAEKKAIDRGVKIKEIIQEYNQENKDMIASWIRQGVKLRFGPAIGFHLLLFDNKISYLMSYDPKDKAKRYAVRIVHQAINTGLQGVFDKYWCQATKINR